MSITISRLMSACDLSPVVVASSFEQNKVASAGAPDASTTSGKADHDDHTVDGPEALGLDEHASKIIADFQLNADQIAVLRHCSRWAVSDKVGRLAHASPYHMHTHSDAMLSRAAITTWHASPTASMQGFSHCPHRGHT